MEKPSDDKRLQRILNVIEGRHNSIEFLIDSYNGILPPKTVETIFYRGIERSHNEPKIGYALQTTNDIIDSLRPTNCPQSDAMDDFHSTFRKQNLYAFAYTIQTINSVIAREHW